MGKGVTHGLRATYVSGCRCPECKAANTAYFRTRRTSRFGVQPSRRPPGRVCGTVSKYVGGGCRCDACKQAASAYYRKYRAGKRGQTPPSHGYSTYTAFGCRCGVCRKAAFDYMRSYRQSKKAGKN